MSATRATTTAYAAVTRAAYANGWNLTDSETGMSLTRGNRRVFVRFSTRGAIVTATTARNIPGSDGTEWETLGTLTARDANKSERVTLWLVTTESFHVAKDTADAARSHVDPFTAPVANEYPVPTAANAAVTAVDPFTADTRVPDGFLYTVTVAREDTGSREEYGPFASLTEASDAGHAAGTDSDNYTTNVISNLTDDGTVIGGGGVRLVADIAVRGMGTVAGWVIVEPAEYGPGTADGAFEWDCATVAAERRESARVAMLETNAAADHVHTYTDVHDGNTRTCVHEYDTVMPFYGADADAVRSLAAQSPESDYERDNTPVIDTAVDAAERAHWARVDADIESARQELTDAVTALARMERIATGFQPAVTASAPDNYPDLFAAYENGRDVQDDGGTAYLPVWNGASEHSVYTSADANHAFRFWHDMGHVTNRLTFTPEDERRLQTDHHIPAIERMGIEYHSLAWWLYYADTIGQIDYVVARGAFPADQISFVIDYALDRIDGGDGTFAVHAGTYDV